MKHAGPDALTRLAPLLESLRAQTGLTERRPGIFYRGSTAFLHFHEDPGGLFADVKLNGATVFERHRVDTRAEQRALLAAVEATLAARAGKSRTTA